MKNNWTLVSIGIGLLGGVLSYLIVKDWRIALLVSIISTFAMLLNNPIKRYMRAFWVILSMFLVLNRFFFSAIGTIGDVDFSFGSNEIHWIVSIGLLLLAGVCLRLDFLERNGIKESFGSFFNLRISSDNIGGSSFSQGNKSPKSKNIIATDKSSVIADQSDSTVTITGSPNSPVDLSKHYHLDSIKPRIKTFREWTQEDESFNDPFFFNQKLDGFIKSIREILLVDSSSNIRVLGLSGLGKTRLVHECFSSFEDYKDEVYYCDVSSQVDEVVLYLRKLINEKGKGCFIIDNCKLRLNQLLYDDIKKATGAIHLITIDTEVRERFSEDKNIVLVKLNPKDYEGEIISKLISHYYPNLPEPDIEKIASFSQGFPLVAKQLAYARDLGSENIGELSDDDLLRRLIGVEEKEDEDAYHVLRACSIFEKLGYSLDLRIHKEFVANTSAISRLTNPNKVELFENKCSTFLSRGILEKQGRFITVRPKPLAIRLAADWWRECIGRGDAFEIIQQITEQGLGDDLCAQIAKLDFLPEAQQLTRDLCGPQAPFGKAEVLNTSEGSRLFRSLAEVNPGVATETLFYHYGDAHVKQLIKVEAGRRYLVWTLEKLCFIPETFDKAAKVLLNLAAAENENISNNATGQFLQLYQLLLPGTSADLEQRFGILDYALAKKHPIYSELALSAMKRSLSSVRRASRMLGAENFGSSPKLKDHRPTKAEVENYYSKILKLLEDQVCNNKELAEESKTIIGKSIGGIFDNGFGEIAFQSVSNILECHPGFWKDGFISAIHLYSYSEGKFDNETKKGILNLVKQLKPREFSDQYEMIVKAPTNWDFETDIPWRELREQGKDYNELEKKNISYLINHNIDRIDDWDFEIFFNDQQQRSVFFGGELGRYVYQRNEKSYKDILSKLIKIIVLNDDEIKDVSFLAGFLGSSEDDDLKNDTLYTLIDKKLPAHHFLNIARFCSPNIEKLISWVDLFAKDDAPLSSFQILAYGKVLNHLSVEGVLRLGEKIASKGDKNIYIALDIISSYVEIGDKNWETAKTTIKELLSSKGFISKAEHFGGMTFISIGKYITEFLKEDDENFIHHLKNEVLDHITDSGRLSYNSEVENILRTLINDHFETVWDDIGGLMLTNPEFYLMAKFHLGVRESTMYSEGILFSNPENLPLLFDWCKKNAPKAPRLIAGIMPTTSKSEDGDIKWHSFAKRIIDSFGDDDRLLNELHANFGSYGTWGSSVPYLESKLQLLKLLKDHEIKRVRTWANDYISEIGKSIQLEKIRDEEWGVK